MAYNSSSNHAIKSCCLILLCLAALGAEGPALGGDLPSPIPNSSVHDFAGVIKPEEKTAIQAEANRLKYELKTEIALVTINTLDGEDSFDYSTRMARAWGIGSKDNDIRGLLILVAIKDHKTAFRTSRHIEGELNDAVCGDISREMNQLFKKEDFGGGLVLGVDRVIDRLQKTAPPLSAAAPTERYNPQGGPNWWLLFMIMPCGVGILLLIMLVRLIGGKLGGRRESAYGPNYPPQPTTPGWSEPSSSFTSPSSSESSWSSSSDSSSSSSSSDSGSSYSGGSDFGGGGSDSSW